MAEILVVDDLDKTMELCRKAIPEHTYRGPVRCWREAAELLGRSRGRIDLVLLDVHFDIPATQLIDYSERLSERDVERLRRRQGLLILKALRTRYPDLPVILMTSREELEIEQQAERLQAQEYTYFLDDEYVDARALRAQIDGIIAARRGLEADGPIYWGRSIKMRRLRQKLSVLARGRLPVVLLGPTGTGKSLIAKHFIHAHSGRKGRFVSVDLSTVPRELMAAHLFGSVKGAYTGSVTDKKGAFEEADGGTLFLDEVGNLTAEAQKMLLSVLQEGVVTRLGDLKERTVDVKLVVATNDELSQSVLSGSFRADLYMRLNPASAVNLPRLKDRGAEFERLLAFCLQQALDRPYLQELLEEYRSKHGLPRSELVLCTQAGVPEPQARTIHLLLPKRTLNHLKKHSWPGNLREFAMTVENAVLFSLSEMLTVMGGDRQDVIVVRPKLIRDLLRSSPVDEGAGDESGLKIEVRLDAQDTLNRVAQECEKQYFTQLYVNEKGDFAQMAKALLGDAEHARKVQLRFNQLGLKVRELKERIR